MASFERVSEVGDALIYRGDPRLPTSDIDTWWNGILGKSSPATARPHLYGADAGLCARKNVFYSQNTWQPDILQPSTRTYMAIGVALENLLADSLREKDRLIVQNSYLISLPEVKVRGKIDLVILDHQEEIALIEVKSCGELPLKPNVQHLAQALTYSAISGLRKVYLTYISRKVQEQTTWGPSISIRSFPVETDTETLLDILGTIVFSDLCIKDSSIPKVSASFRKTEECRYCPFLNYCWSKEPRYRTSESDLLPEPSPIRELSLEEELNLLDKSKTIATKLLLELPLRRTLTLNSFLEDDSLSPYLKKKIQEEL